MNYDISNENLQWKMFDAGGLLQRVCHGLAKQAGWWTKNGEDLTVTPHDGPGGTLFPPTKFNVPEKLMLIVSEVAEGMEGHRKSLMDDKLPHRTMLEVELADTVIRCFDLAGGLSLDLGGAIAEKLAFNAVRPDHKIEVRQAAGGKAF